MDDSARRFDAKLLALNNDGEATAGLDRGATQNGAHDTVRDDVLLVAALRRCEIPQAEAEGARERVHALLMSALASDGAMRSGNDEAARPPVVADNRRLQKKAVVRGLIRATAVAAALVAVSAAGGWQVSNAAASAYPDSPLYGVKRIEERLALGTAWSDQRRAEVLATVADHRLGELTYEAAEHNMPLVHALAGEYSGDMCSLINLAASMQRRHENTSIVLTTLSHELNAEGSAIRSAWTSGNSMLSEALTSAIQAQQAAISAGHLDVTPPALSDPRGSHHASGASTPSDTSGGQGGGKVSQQGNGGGNGQGSRSKNEKNGGNAGTSGHGNSGGKGGNGGNDAKSGSHGSGEGSSSGSSGRGGSGGSGGEGRGKGHGGGDGSGGHDGNSGQRSHGNKG